MQEKVKELNFHEQNIYTGIDIHLKNWVVTVMLEHSLHKKMSINPSGKDLKNYLDKNFPGGNYLTAYEAGFTGFSTHWELENCGFKNIVVNPADIPTTDKERRQKEDKRDSLKIAKSLRSGDLNGIYIPRHHQVELRSLVRHRKTLVKEISRNKSRIKSLLYFNGIKIPDENRADSHYWSNRFTTWLKFLEFKTPEGKMVMNQILEIVEFLRGKLLEVNQEFRKMKKSGCYSKELELLCSIPGIGTVIAMTILSEICDFERFKNLDKLCSFVGLVPSTNSSGEKEIAGKITPRSNRPIRSVIIEAAWVASRVDPVLSLKYNELCKRMKPSEAIIRIAKKLLSRIRYVMINKTPYVYSVIN
ncbi:MAG TPA: IS110 family transposase [Bacteroidales bacterium]|nr:IS110 family transposase [Bacteroidales bacterium]